MAGIVISVLNGLGQLFSEDVELLVIENEEEIENFEDSTWESNSESESDSDSE